MTPEKAKQFIRQSGFSVVRWAAPVMASNTLTIRLWPSACKVIIVITRSDTSSAASKAKMPAPAKAVTTPPITQNSTDEGVTGPSAIDSMPAIPTSATSNMGQLRRQKLLLGAALMFLAASSLFISMALLIADSTEYTNAAISAITFSQLCMSIFFFNQPKLAP